MESKITLYASDDSKIGETYARRAKQLVKQQRACWVNESAIKFVEVAEVELIPEPEVKTVTVNEEKLLKIALRRIESRNRMILHTLLLVPVWLAFFVFCAGFLDGWLHWSYLNFILGLGTGSWLMLYGVHLWKYFSPKIKKMRINASREERKSRIIAKEIATLKIEMNEM